MASTPAGGFTDTYLFHQLDEYPWDTDQEFQGGLRAILGDVSDPAQVRHLTLRAKCYYFARKAGTPVDFEGYQRWVDGERPGGNEAVNGIGAAPEQSSAGAVASASGEQAASAGDAGVGGMGNAPYSASFAEICDMIAEGKPIPGIKDIPDTILEGQKSESSAQGRRKPWEKNIGSEGNDGQEALSWMR